MIIETRRLLLGPRSRQKERCPWLLAQSGGKGSLQQARGPPPLRTQKAVAGVSSLSLHARPQQAEAVHRNNRRNVRWTDMTRARVYIIYMGRDIGLLWATLGLVMDCG